MQPIHWTTLEFEPQERHRDWNWYTGLVAVIAAILAFFYGDIFFGIFIIIAGTTVLIYAQRPPKTLDITVDDKGILVSGEMIEYASVKQFWLDETDKQDKLLLLVKGSFVPLIALPLQGVTAESVRAVIKPHAEEAELKESRTIKIFERLGF
ncbi:MAG: protein of unknown function with transrane region [Candidatus Nomurabacteria bacterium]|nr:protein of unknown function with transrane region [Candidatus Nomurabacteria bacterium]